MKQSIFFIVIAFTFGMSGCKDKCKSETSPSADNRLNSYIFKPGTYWVYTEPGGRIDSQYVFASGYINQRVDTGYLTSLYDQSCGPHTSNLAYMKIYRYFNGTIADTITIGEAASLNQLYLWGFNYINKTDVQIIFQLDQSSPGTYLGSGLYYGGTNSEFIPGIVNGVNASYFAVSVLKSNNNQIQGTTAFYFYPGYGIVAKTEYGTQYGDLYWTLQRINIIP